MNAQPLDSGSMTYLPSEEDAATVVDLVAVLESRGFDVSEARPALVSSDGRRMELPQPLFEALHQIAIALAHRQGVTVAPHDTLLTTQEAADLLGISRPTLVRLLNKGEIPHQMRGRHRRVTLADLVAYQQRTRHERKQVLDEMTRSAEEAGMYEATAGPPPRTR